MHFPPHDDLWDEVRDFDQRMTLQALDILCDVGERWRLEYQGDVLQVKHVAFSHEKPPRGNRAKITGFSAKSRWNLMLKSARWNWAEIGPSTFVTLTYPDAWARVEQDDRNKHRYLWHRKLECWRGCNTPMLWRVEYAERKSGEVVGDIVPHWHFLLFGVEFVPYRLVNEWWKTIIGYDDYVRTDIRAVVNEGGAARYLSKYLAKDVVSHSLVRATNHNIVGRHWGILREKEIPLHEKLIIPSMTDDQTEEVYGLVEQMLSSVHRQSKSSFTALGPVARDILAILKKCGVDVPDKAG